MRLWLNLLTGLLVIVCQWTFDTAVAMPTSTGQKSLSKLIHGNERFAHNQARHPHQSHEQLVLLSHEQHPFVAILTCSDSRIAPELIFDQGLGDIFDVRIAGNIADDAVMGSLEYAVEHLHVPLIIVLGHENCGAVQAAMAHEHPHNHLNHIIRSLAPAVHKSPGSLEAAIKDNVQLVIKKLSKTHTLQEGIESGNLQIVGAYYHLDTGQVELLSSANTP